MAYKLSLLIGEWNSLPNEILDVQEQLTIHSFKTKLNNHLR